MLTPGGTVQAFGTPRPRQMSLAELRGLERLLTDVVLELHQSGGASAHEACNSLALIASRCLGQLIAQTRA